MIKVTLEIDNKMAHSYSPLRYLKDYIIYGAENLVFTVNGTEIETPYAKITVKEIEQI